MRISHICHIRPLTRCYTTRITDGPVRHRTTVEIIISVIPEGGWEKHWPTTWTITKWNWGRCWHLQTLVSHAFDDLTTDTPFLPINQTSCSRIAYQPVVYVALDENLSAKLFPQKEVNGVVVCLAHWWSCWYGNIISLVHRPVWYWCDCVRTSHEKLIISKGVAPHQSPASSISVHITVSLERIGMGPTIWINPINPRRRKRKLTSQGLARGHCWWLGRTCALLINMIIHLL